MVGHQPLDPRHHQRDYESDAHKKDSMMANKTKAETLDNETVPVELSPPELYISERDLEKAQKFIDEWKVKKPNGRVFLLKDGGIRELK